MIERRISVVLDEKTIRELDRLVKEMAFPSRNDAIRVAVDEKLRRMKRLRFERECAKLDPAYEKALAEEGFNEDMRNGPNTKGDYWEFDVRENRSWKCISSGDFGPA